MIDPVLLHAGGELAEVLSRTTETDQVCLARVMARSNARATLTFAHLLIAEVGRARESLPEDVQIRVDVQVYVRKDRPEAS